MVTRVYWSKHAIRALILVDLGTIAGMTFAESVRFVCTKMFSIDSMNKTNRSGTLNTITIQIGLVQNTDILIVRRNTTHCMWKEEDYEGEK